MCGICGVFHLDREQHVQESALALMNATSVHRGPDDSGWFVDQNAGLAARRLSVIDVRTGHQPLFNEDETLVIVYNGEIYNHRELRSGPESRGHRYRSKSDTETVIHLYEEHGRNCVQHLRGMFAFAIWDRRRRTLFLARDRLGIKPLYYRFDGKTFLLASEIKAVLAYPDVKVQFNQSKLAEYLAFGYIAGPETMFAGIHKLLPGHMLELNENGELRVEQYWDLSVPEDPDWHPREYYVKTYRELLEKSVASHLMSDVPLGVFLSGGVDSSAVAALATKVRRAPVGTFSVGYGEEAFSELHYARQVAQHLGSDHREVRLSQREFFNALPELTWHEDEPIVWPSSVSLYFVAKLAREHVKVVLTGEGSDETLAGYTRYAFTLKNSRMDGAYRMLVPHLIRHLVRNGINASPLSAAWHRKLQHTFLLRDGSDWPSFYFDNFYSAFSAAEQNELLDDKIANISGDAYAGTMHYWQKSTGDLLHRMLRTDMKTYLVELLMKQDQMSMAASVESRVPFLDHKLAEFTATIPGKYNIDGLRGKSILKSAVADLLPRSITHRQKMGFPTPWAFWLAGPQLDDLQAMLLQPRSTERGLFKREAVQRLLAEHRAGQRDHGNRIWRLLTLETWFRVFVDGEAPAKHQAAQSSPAVISDRSISQATTI